WYTVHKLMSGLVDAYLYAGNKKSLKLVTGMADWTFNTVDHLPDSLRLKMLNCEYGGMNDVLANIYAITGNKKYLDLSYKFYDEFVMSRLAQRIDPMPGKHSNTNVPKAIGSARQYQLTGNERDNTIASFFWKTMVDHHSYVIGGNSNYEYCGPADKLSDRLSDNTCETCNTYNMLKLTQHLFAASPSSVLMDYYEKALYNHILASQNPTNGMTCYFVPLRMGAKKVFSDSVNTFTCCVGSGMENHTKYAAQVYSHDGNNTLFVNLFIPSVLQWKQKGVEIRQENFIPEQKQVKLVIACKRPTRFTLKVRKPAWLRNAPVLHVNGKAVDTQLSSEGYFTTTRQWKDGDLITADLSMDVYSEAMPDNANRIALKYGPVVLAGKLGKQMPDPIYGTPVLLTNDKNVNNWIKPALNKTLAFEMNEAAKPFKVTMVPFYQVYDEYYSVYWDYFTNEEWLARQKEYEAEKARQKEIEEKTIDNFRIGEMQPERDHNLTAGERSYIDEALGRPGREARSGSHFVFEMKVQPGIQNTLLLTYIGDDKDRKFDIKADGELIATEHWQGGQTSRFYDKTYAIPMSFTYNKEKISIRIEANYRKTAGRIFAVRIIK
ncbi:MAG TPA: beta-L-arabinofuranosidase domain-containing protein, partial [Ferruginibacter sp.]|nr:beta-L-arabinofuranosidase domain-containing protein [Ferruginibacter sp.]